MWKQVLKRRERDGLSDLVRLWDRPGSEWELVRWSDGGALVVLAEISLSRLACAMG